MKRILLALGLVLAVLAGLTVISRSKMRSERPDVIIGKLRNGKGDREALLMKLSLCRGDSVPDMIAGLRDTAADEAFRVKMIELLFAKYRRSGDERILPVLKEALDSPRVAIRLAAVAGFDLYGNDAQRLFLLPRVTDTDPEIRRTVLTTLCAPPDRHSQKYVDPFWNTLSLDQRTNLVAACRAQLPREKDEVLTHLLRSAIGREVEYLCNQATQCIESGDFAKGERLLLEALAVDPESHQARIRLARHYLSEGIKDKALAAADKCGALLHFKPLRTAPTIDGDPTDAAWQDAFRYENRTFYHSTSRWAAKAAEGKTDMYLGYRDGTLYVAVLGYEPDMTKLIIKHKGRDDNCYQDECVEIFFDPGAMEAEVYQFIFNPIGAMMDLYKGRIAENMSCDHAAKVFADRGYWACEVALPLKSLHNRRLEPDAVWGFNLCRTRIGPASECGSVWPLYGWNHRYGFYPLAVFDPPAR
ncbi:MAG: hypothetical protein PHR35_00695 [Kiritimatiellae bacterium]|nr:hypothetical protein [Kiritimatiellia bacterium]